MWPIAIMASRFITFWMDQGMPWVRDLYTLTQLHNQHYFIVAHLSFNITTGYKMERLLKSMNSHTLRVDHLPYIVNDAEERKPMPELSTIFPYHVEDKVYVQGFKHVCTWWALVSSDILEKKLEFWYPLRWKGARHYQFPFHRTSKYCLPSGTRGVR